MSSYIRLSSPKGRVTTAKSPGSDISQDSGNYNDVTSGSTDDDTSSDDEHAIERMRTCALKLWKITEAMKSKLNNNHVNDNDAIPTNWDESNLGPRSSSYQDAVSKELNKLRAEITASSDERSLNGAGEKVESLINELTQVSLGMKKKRRPNKKTNVLRQTFTVPTLGSALSPAGSRLPKVAPLATSPVWSDFPPTRAKRAPRNLKTRKVLIDLE